MAKHTIIKKRINLEAWKLKEFTSKQLLKILNDYPNMDKRGKTKIPLTMGRLLNLLRQNKHISVKEKYTHGDTRTLWQWEEIE